MIEPEWNDFKVVLALGRGGSVIGAARLLGVDSSTVSRRLAAVEEAIGAVLVIRGGREFSLTAEGKEAFAAAQAIEAVITSAASSIRAAKTGVEGVVRISSVPSLMRVLMQFGAMLNEKYPKLSIELNSAYRVADLARGEAEISIRMVEPTELDVIAKHAFEWATGLYASKAYVAKHGLPVTPEELERHHLVRYVETMLHLPTFNWIESYADKLAPAFRVDSTEMAIATIASGVAIGTISCYAGDSNPDLVRVFPDPVVTVSGWIVYHETSRSSARVKAVVDMLSAFFEEQQDLFAGKRQAN